MIDIDSYFQENLFNLDEKAIYSLSEQDYGPINNVITNLEECCYGLVVYGDKEFIEYMIFYIDNKHGLNGLGLMLSLKLDLNTRTIFTIEFSKVVNNRYSHTDVVDTFNTIQNQARTVFEKMGFFTIGNEVNKFLNGRSAEAWVSGEKGILSFPTFDKVELYRWYFGENKDYILIDDDKVKKIYLILDSINNLIKIGQSYYPNLREKTLQGISPKWDLITTWIAPVSEEKELHNMFKNKRRRGEWFDLSFSDLEIIKEYMQKYK